MKRILFVVLALSLPSQATAQVDEGYVRLHRALVTYERVNKKGGWGEVPAGPKMMQGDEGERVVTLRRRLWVVGDLKKDKGNPLFDEGLREAVRHFQSRHGLEEDGMVGKATLAALNVPVTERLAKIEWNLAHWKEGPPEGEPMSVVINIPAYTLSLMEEREPLLTMRVVVGMKSWPTPRFDARMTHLVFNPRWHVPTKIALQEVIRDARSDPDYFVKKGMRVFTTVEGKTEEVDPAGIDWNNSSQNFRQYSFRQDSGERNALGRIKFLLPNPFDIYLHDTPSKGFFRRAVRSLSHGCIRLEKPLELASEVLKNDATWNRERIGVAIAKGTEQFVKLLQPIPVHLFYRTAWVEEDETIEFREDIYGLER